MTLVQRCAVFVLGCCAALGAWAQPVGHLGVPGTQMVHSAFAPVAGLPATNHYLLNVVHPDATVDTMSSAYLARQTLVYVEVVLILYRTSSSVLSGPETGEIYIGDYDSSLKGKPLQDQMALVRFTIPANETRLVLRVPMPGGRAFSGYRQPVIVNYGSAGVGMNARATGYLLPN